jgi:hypothetical protein
MTDIRLYSAKALVEWARLAEEWSTYELGSDSDLAEDMRQALVIPQSQPMWAQSSKMSVGGPRVH